MGIFSKIFSKSEQNLPDSNQYTFKFGRYTDMNKSKFQLKNWDESVRLYKEKEYIKGFEAFLLYIKEENKNNVEWKNSVNSDIHFTILQGSRQIIGRINSKEIIAETALAKISQPNVGFMRKLLNLNYLMQYTRFAIHDNLISQRFYSSTQSLNPSKIYAALKEMALNGDKQDDLLIQEFSGLESIEQGIIHNINENEAKVKYKYFIKWIDKAIETVDKHSDQRVIPGNSWVLLNLIYKLDYLVSPEGSLVYELEKISQQYFNNKTGTDFEKNREMINAIKQLRNIEESKFLKSMYTVEQTFGVLTPASHKTVYEFILDKMKDTKWYLENRYYEIELNIYEYILGYCFFSYGMFQPTKELMHIGMVIFNPDFFNDLGVNHQFIDAPNGKLNKVAIEKNIQKIMLKWKAEYPKMDFKLSRLRYESVADFMYSYLDEITYLNFQK